MGSPRGSPRQSHKTSPRNKATTPRARNGMEQLAAGFPDGPEMDANVVATAKRFATGGGSPRSATSKSSNGVPAAQPQLGA